MTFIVGLGNPGKKYIQTRHNVGFMVIDKLARKYDLKFEENIDYYLCKGSIEGKEVTIIKPKTYMNLSGKAVKKLIDEEIIRNLPDSLIVIHDDLDLPIGKMKIKKNGSSGGHKGVQSIIEHLGTKNFIRIKIGIGKDTKMDVSDYVLSSFSKEQKPLIKEKVLQAVDAIVMILNNGVEKAMNTYNREN